MLKSFYFDWHQPTCEYEKEYDSELVHGVTKNIFHHGSGYQCFVAAVWFAEKEGFSGLLRRQRQRRHRIHDQVDP